MYTEEEFANYYSYHTNVETSKHFKIVKTKLVAIARNLGIEKTDKNTKKMFNVPKKDIFDEFYQSHSIEECAINFGVSKGTISLWRKYLKVKRKYGKYTEPD